MISYPVYIIIMILHLVLGHPIPPNNNQICWVPILAPPNVLYAQLYLTARGPNNPEYYDPLAFTRAVGSDDIRARNFRSDPSPDGPNEQIGHVQVQNFGNYVHRVHVIGQGVNGTECTFPTFAVAGGTRGSRFVGFSWVIQSGYTYYLIIE